MNDKTAIIEIGGDGISSIDFFGFQSKENARTSVKNFGGSRLGPVNLEQARVRSADGAAVGTETYRAS